MLSKNGTRHQATYVGCEEFDNYKKTGRGHSDWAENERWKTLLKIKCFFLERIIRVKIPAPNDIVLP